MAIGILHEAAIRFVAPGLTCRPDSTLPGPRWATFPGSGEAL